MKSIDVVIYGYSEVALVCAFSAIRTYPDKTVLLINPSKSKVIIEDLLSELTSKLNTSINIINSSINKRDGCDLILENGKKLSFEKLVIATGSRVAESQIDGINKDGVHLVDKELENIHSIKEQAINSESIVVFGGGYIGVELTDELLRADKKVTIIERSTRLLPSSFDSEISNAAKQIVEKQGGTVILNNKVKAILGINRVTGVELRNGEVIDCDFLIVCCGNKPNLEVAEKLGIIADRDRGILVDDYFRTSDKNIFAIGDCAAKFDFFRGDLRGFLMRTEKIEEAELVGCNLYSIIYNRGQISSYLSKKEDVIKRINNYVKNNEVIYEERNIHM